MPVSHLTQIGTGWNNCGPANFAMLRNLYRPARPLTVLRARLLMGGGTGFTSLQGLEAALDREGVPSLVWGAADMDFYERAMLERVPVIALIDYREIRNNPPPTLTQRYEYAHFVLVVNVAGGTVWVHDPLHLTGPTPLARSEFVKAISSRSRYIGGTNDPYLAVVPEYPYTPGMELLGDMRARSERLGVDISALTAGHE